MNLYKKHVNEFVLGRGRVPQEPVVMDELEVMLEKQANGGQTYQNVHYAKLKSDPKFKTRNRVVRTLTSVSSTTTFYYGGEYRVKHIRTDRDANLTKVEINLDETYKFPEHAMSRYHDMAFAAQIDADKEGEVIFDTVCKNCGNRMIVIRVVEDDAVEIRAHELPNGKLTCALAGRDSVQCAGCWKRYNAHRSGYMIEGRRSAWERVK